MTSIEKSILKELELVKKKDKSTLPKSALKYAIAILLDISYSMEGEKIEDAKEALIHFLKSVSLGENEVGLVAFGAGIHTCELTQDRVRLETKIKSFNADNETPMMRALRTAFEKILNKKVNPVIVIATDGQPTDALEEEILDYVASIKKNGVWMITIGIGEDVNEDFLKELASSPDDYRFAKASFELKAIYKEVAAKFALPAERRRGL